jgi:hypothetical protein
LAALGAAVLAPPAGAATTQQFPSYTLDASHTLSSSLVGDIAGSAFVGADGTFHWLSSYADYTTTDSGSYTTTFTNTDLGALNAQAGSGTTSVADDTYYDRPGSLCYQVDKAAENPAPSPYEDDHCDVVGVWVDPATGYWYGVVNDEYDFDPWATTDPTVAQRITTGIHGNRILTAYSTDQGADWNFGGQIITSPFTDDGAFDATAAPGNTWDYGDAGVRLYVDYATGYFYVVYNTTIKTKPGYTSVAMWPSIARAPISGKMAPGTWNKYDDGTWTQPGIGGVDGNVGNPLGLEASYTPSTDAIAFEGTGADGSSVDYQSVYVSSGGSFTFDDASGASYTADTGTGTIVNSAGTSVSSVSYQDPALDSAVTVTAGGSSGISVSITSAAGATQTATVTNMVLEDATTHRVYLSPTEIYESALTYNTYSEAYLSIGYDKYVYTTMDLGQPNSLTIVGAEPSAASDSYLTSLDYGSLTNQNISTRSFRMISALSGGAWDVTMTPHSSGQPDYVVGRTPVDSTGTAISGSDDYTLNVGGTGLSDPGSTASTADEWQFVPVADSFDTAYPSGVYKIENVATGDYLQVDGSTPAAQRAIGATVGSGSAQADYAASGNSGNGSPGGSDQWYLEPVGNDTPATLSPSSSAATVAAATDTSLAGVGTYKLVNRNSGLVLEYVGGGWQLAGQSFGSSGQTLAINPS